MSRENANHTDVMRQLAAYLDGTLDPDHYDALRERLHREPQLLHAFAQMAQLEEDARLLLSEQAATAEHGPDRWLTLLSELDAGQETLPVVELHEQPDPEPKPNPNNDRDTESDGLPRVIVIPKPVAYAAVLAVAAGVLLAIGALVTPGGNDLASQARPTTDAPMITAAATRTRGAVWSGGGPDSAGVLTPGAYRLDAGFAELTFGRGARVLMHGPSSFELIDADTMRMVSGMAHAHVPDGAEGFTIETSAGSFVDLGTDFGVDVAGPGRAELHVFDGLVEAHIDHGLAPDTPRNPTPVRGGEAVGLDRASESALPLAVRPEKFVSDWASTQTDVVVTEQIRYLYTPPTSVKSQHLEHDEQIFIFKENAGLVLDRRVRVSIAEPSRYSVFPEEHPALEPGTQVDSYLVHFDRVGSAPPPMLLKVGGMITFDREVLAIIVHDELLDRSERLFAAAGTRYPGKGMVRGLEDYTPSTGELQDEVTLSADRRTVVMCLHTSNSMDQMRILVAPQTSP